MARTRVILQYGIFTVAVSGGEPLVAPHSRPCLCVDECVNRLFSLQREAEGERAGLFFFYRWPRKNRSGPPGASERAYAMRSACEEAERPPQRFTRQRRRVRSADAKFYKSVFSFIYSASSGDWLRYLLLKPRKYP